MGEQYDVSKYLKSRFDEAQKQRNAVKTYYRNLLYNPHLPPDQGLPFDPAIHRYGAMSVYHVERYKPKFKHFAAFFLNLAPVLIVTYHLHYKRNQKEKLLRSGEVAYSDRRYKMIM